MIYGACVASFVYIISFHTLPTVPEHRSSIMQDISTDPYFQNTPPTEFRFLDYYRHRQNQPDFTFSFKEESGRLWRCLESLVNNGLSDVESAAKRPEKGKHTSMATVDAVHPLYGGTAMSTSFGFPTFIVEMGPFI
ncbi:8768_t:CDS:2 [Ambispora leptoticha]|uniref:8768_t:CDS:1 n=1 Tax=Ambispora leptoticha TaxID=144679 RepID=A0A9N9A1V5_9GLOM|nr:8768_t:CDS:2 [Ambispora leptoticha]